MQRPIILIDIQKHRTTTYASIHDAEVSTGISKQRLIRALQSDSGLVLSVQPPLYVDYLLESEDGAQ